MARSKFTSRSFLLRLLFAAALVFVTYNPVEPFSYYHWALRPLLENFADFSIGKSAVGVALLIGWGVFLSATYNSLGLIGMILISLFFGLLVWWMIDAGWVSLDNPSTLNWIILIVLCAVLAAGISWSHLRRRLTGQIDVDTLEE